MSAVIGNLLGGNIFGAISEMLNESPQENIREAAGDILKGDDVAKNMAKLRNELIRMGGDREKMAQVDSLMQQMDAGQADQTSTMEQILAIVDRKSSEKNGSFGNLSGQFPKSIEF